MKENELQMIATHLGHDPKTHKEYYRLSNATVELTTVHTALFVIKDINFFCCTNNLLCWSNIM